MKDLLVIEEIDVFDINGNIVSIPKGEKIQGKYDGDAWEIRYNGGKYWQYNYSIEDFILYA